MKTMTEIEHDLSLRIPRLVELWRNTGSRDALTPKELAAAGNALLSLQRGLTGSRQLAGAGYMDDKALSGAYLLYYWPVSYVQTALAASYAQNVLAVFNRDTIRILDLGSGPGPASCALEDVLYRTLPEVHTIEITAADSSDKALGLAQKLLQKQTVRITTRTCNLEAGIRQIPDTGPYDIIVMSHALNELWKNAADNTDRRYTLLREAAERLTEDGILFVSEPALLETSRSLLAVRDKLVSEGFTILSPCRSASACPALAAGPNHTCHAEVSWQPPEPVASLAKIAGLDRESVKMSFIIAGKTPLPGNQTEAHSLHETEHTVTARVVSDPMLNKSGRVRILLCDGESRFPFSAKKGDPAAAAAGFFGLHRYDVLEITSPEVRGDSGAPAYGFADGTTIRIGSRIE